MEKNRLILLVLAVIMGICVCLPVMHTPILGDVILYDNFFGIVMLILSAGAAFIARTRYAKWVSPAGALVLILLVILPQSIRHQNESLHQSALIPAEIKHALNTMQFTWSFYVLVIAATGLTLLPWWLIKSKTKDNTNA